MGGHRTIMFKKINQIVEERYLDGDHITLYDKNGIHLAEVIESMLEEEDTISQYSVDYSELPLGHGEKSVIRLLQIGFALTQDEILAIRWHMTAWELPFQSNEAKANLNEAKQQCPLLTIIQTADGLASAILEEKR